MHLLSGHGDRFLLSFRRRPEFPLDRSLSDKSAPWRRSGFGEPIASAPSGSKTPNFLDRLSAAVRERRFRQRVHRPVNFVYPIGLRRVGGDCPLAGEV